MAQTPQKTMQENASSLVLDITTDLASSLPPNIPFDKFKSVFITAVLNNPKILNCDPVTIKTALLKCAQDNLLPDGREAAIIPYNNRVKDGDNWVNVVTAQYTPMIQGIRKRAKELGGISEIVAEPVHEKDDFDHSLGDNPFIHHKPAKLGTDRGKIIGAYAIFKDDDGRVVHRELMDFEAIEKARAVSKNQDGDLWTIWYGEACKKTVVRRGSKNVPSIPDALRAIITRDDELVDFSLPRSLPKAQENPLLEQQVVRTDDQAPRQEARQSSAEAAGQNGAGSAAGESGRLPAPENKELMLKFSGALLRLKGDNLVKGRKNFWVSHPQKSEPTDQEKQLEELIYQAHVNRDNNKLSVDDLKSHVTELIEEVYGCTSS